MGWLTKLVPGHAPDGGPILSVLAKRAYSIAPGRRAKGLPASAARWVETDCHWGAGNPAQDATMLETDLVAWKPCTDVIVVGQACAPRGKRARFFEAAIRVGSIRKTVRVFGERRIRPKTFGFDFTEPDAFETMPLHHGLAYGGRHRRILQGDELVYPRNPVGRGFVVHPTIDELLALQLPNLENPAHLLTPETLALKSYDRWIEAPEPWALGCTSRNAHPRASLAGLPPDQAIATEIVRLQTATGSPAESPHGERAGGGANLGMNLDTGPAPNAAPNPPVVMNPAYACAASQGLILPHLRGDETVELVHMDADHPTFAFELPGERPAAWIDIGVGAEWMDMVLQSVLVFKGVDRVELVWRGSCRYDGPESMGDWERFEMGVQQVLR